MILFPAIDLKDGKCVRLYKGDMNEAIIFSDSPVAQARKFQDQGAEWLHIVDLNGAFAGEPVNFQAVLSIIGAVKIPIQLGGGIRNMETIEAWLSTGVERVILGTVALKNPDLVREACKKFPGKIAVGIDGKNGFVATEGWAESSKTQVIDLAKEFEDAGVACIIFTEISRDGAMEGIDIQAIKKLAMSVKVPIIASGGVSDVKDLEQLKAIEDMGVTGVISGRAIYEKTFTIKEAKMILS